MCTTEGAKPPGCTATAGAAAPRDVSWAATESCGLSKPKELPCMRSWTPFVHSVVSAALSARHTPTSPEKACVENAHKLYPRGRPRSLAKAARTPPRSYMKVPVRAAPRAPQAPAAWQAAPGSRVKVRSAISLIMSSAKLHPPARISPNRSVSVDGLHVIGRVR